VKNRAASTPVKAVAVNIYTQKGKGPAGFLPSGKLKSRVSPEEPLFRRFPEE